MQKSLFEADPVIAEAIAQETRRQNETLELIASENFVSEAVLAAAGSIFTNKYAEGYPGRRYYGGCQFVDRVETLAQERAKQRFPEGNSKSGTVSHALRRTQVHENRLRLESCGSGL